MSRPSQPGTTQSERSLVRRSSQEKSLKVSKANDAGSGLRQTTSEKTGYKRSVRKHRMKSTTYLPTSEELSRIERMTALQEHLANLESIPVQGHTYGKVTVSGNARAVRGNLIEESEFPCRSRSHTYGDCEVGEGGMVWDGDIYVTNLKDSQKYQK